MKSKPNPTLTNLLILFILCFTLSNCNDDGLSRDDCESFKQKGAGIGIITENPIQEMSPFWSKDQPNELFYIYSNQIRKNVVKYNVALNNADTVLRDIYYYGQIDIDKKGRMIFSSGYKIMLYNSLINERQVVIDENLNLFPRWYNDSTIIWETSEKLGIPFYTCLFNMNSGKIDTLFISRFGHGAVYREGLIAFCPIGGDGNISVWNDGNTYDVLTVNSSEGDQVLGLDWIDSKRLIYSRHKSGVFVVDIETKEVSQIAEACDSKYYMNISVSENRNELTAEKVHVYNYDENSGSREIQSKIVIMDIDGRNERYIQP